jgi:hypothetical protein
MKSRTVEKTPWVQIRKMVCPFLEEEPTTQLHQSSNLQTVWYTLVKGVMRCVLDTLLQSTGIEKGGAFLYSKFGRVW